MGRNGAVELKFIRYPVAISPDGVVTVPDLGVSVPGDDLGLAQQAAAKRIRELVAAGEPIPAPSMMAEIEARNPGCDYGLIMADCSLWRPEVVN